LKWPDGKVYEGEIENNLENGKGTLTWKNGACYEGEFKSGTMDGAAVYTEPDGTRFEGKYADGKMDGKGVLLGPDGCRYEGEFAHGLEMAWASLPGRTAPAMKEASWTAPCREKERSSPRTGKNMRAASSSAFSMVREWRPCLTEKSARESLK
jgi:hypothetical protein